MKKKISKPKLLFLLASVSVIVLLITPLMGIKLFTFSDLFKIAHEDNRNSTIFWQMRMPRTLVAFLAGAAFSLSGMVFQAIFRNPLVSPFTLGVSAGASLGAAVYIWLKVSFSILMISGISWFSFIGAALSMLIIWALANSKKNVSTTTMLLAGVAISFFFASLIMFLQYVSGINETVRITRWLMGGLLVFGYAPVLQLFPFSFCSLVIVWYFARELNLFTMGKELAVSRGVDSFKVLKILFFTISITIGGIVSICGPIAFIGIIAPHICRSLIGPDHRYLTPAVFLFGGVFLTICDTLARTLAPPTEIPVGVITAMLGGPFFLWILISRSSKEIF